VSLPLLILIPLLGAVILAFLPKDNHDDLRGAALVSSVLTFLVSAVLFCQFDPTASGSQFVLDKDWIPAIGARLSFGIDGLSLLLVMLTTLIMPLTILSSWNSISTRVREYHMSLLALEASMIGVLLVQDLLLFYVFWEAMLIPMFLLIGVWGGEDRVKATIKFFIYTAAGSLLMLGALLYVYLGTEGSFSIPAMTKAARGMPLNAQYWLALAFGIAFAIKVPLFPFHTWLPHAHVQAPAAGSVLLAGVMLKMGGYGFLRFVLPMFPLGAAALAPLVGILAVIGIVYGSMMALAQDDMKRLIAYSSVGHLAMVVLGIFALNRAGLVGGIYQMLSHGLSTGALFLLVGFIYERRHTRELGKLGGIARSAPGMATAFMISTLAAIAVPGTSGFVGEFLILLGAFRANAVLGAIAASGVVLGAAYMLWLMKRVFFGPAEGDNARVEDLTAREWAVLTPLLALMLIMGLIPGPFLARLERAVDPILAALKG